MHTQAPDQREHLRCPDCAARPQVNPNGPVLVHEPTCPVLKVMTKVQQADARWFRKYPNASEYTRLASWPERIALTAFGMPADLASRVTVRVMQVQPGFRLRQFVAPAVAR